MTTKTTPKWWSWGHVIRHAGDLGVPHFQRGAVWEQSNRTALFESMVEKSPCGSFVFWVANDESDPTRHGVPFIHSFAPHASPLWVVDGQQRIRTLLDTFNQLLTEPVHPVGHGLVPPAERAALYALGGEAWHTHRENEQVTDEPAEANGADENADEAGTHTQQFWGVVLPAMDVFNETDPPVFRHVQRKKERNQ